ncbi:hypothetical protein RP20_CCG008901 [Aedes albopictus]|nr:hypothetical protein RP20_CCG008901 [Aedes albopictus]
MAKSTYCIIGAGLAGINAARHAREAGGEVTVFEQTSKVGGTWVYTDEIGKDRHGLDIHTSMYQGLKTNIPKEIMGFPDFPIGEQEESYVTSQDVLKFIENFTEQFELHKHVKFEHHVIRVTRKLDCEKWEVLVKDLQANSYDSYLFDYILVCNGHFFSPFIPKISGHETFKGRQMHSHDYRSPAPFAGKNVVVVGGSHSGMDVAIASASIAKQLALSHRCPERLNIFYDKVVQKPEIARIYENEVEFVDGTRQSCDVLVYCTGYRTSFPFLSVDSGITVEENHVQPLYKHCINIRHPSMAVIGLPFSVCFTLMVDLQIRFCIKFFSGGKRLPSQGEMTADTKADEEERTRRGFLKRQAHMLSGDLQQRYYDDLARIADIEPLKPVLTKLYTVCVREKKLDIMNYRNNVYRIIDDENFIKVN